jgi:hypothetical protein
MLLMVWTKRDGDASKFLNARAKPSMVVDKWVLSSKDSAVGTAGTDNNSSSVL